MKSQRRRRSLRLSMVDGALHAAMVGVSESFLGVLAVKLGHEALGLAMLSTLPLAVGAGAQLFSAQLARLVGGTERLVVFGAVGQAISHVGLLAVALSGTHEMLPLLLAKVAFWVSGSLIGPAWGAWITELTRRVDRSSYLARRTGVVHAALLVSFLLGGLFLEVGPGNILERLAALHVVALVFRLASAAALHGQERMSTTPRARLVNADERPRYGVAWFVAGVWCSVCMTSPFYTPFMLEDLRLGYGAFTVLVAGATLARAAIAPWLGTAASRVGLAPLMLVGAVGIAVTPLFWALFRSFEVLFVAQLFSGAAWAAYELATFQLLIASAGDHARLRFLGVAACLSTTGGVLGALVGALLIRNVSMSYASFFAWGAVVRAVPLVVLVAFVISQRDLLRSTVRGVIFRLETVRPGAGAVARVVFQPPSLARLRRQRLQRQREATNAQSLRAS